MTEEVTIDVSAERKDGHLTVVAKLGGATLTFEMPPDADEGLAELLLENATAAVAILSEVAE